MWCAQCLSLQVPGIETRLTMAFPSSAILRSPWSLDEDRRQGG